VKRSTRLAELERELADVREQLALLHARAAGLEQEIRVLRAGADRPELASARRTDAITAVLADARGSLSPSEIVGLLAAAGRDDDLRSVTATLAHLLRDGRVVRHARGRYSALA
jgi:hypothetical protein